MKRSQVLRLDLRLPGPEQAGLRDPHRQRLLSYAAAVGLIAGLLVVLWLRAQSEELRQVEGRLRAELESLQSAQKQVAARLKSLREIEASWQERQTHQALWVQARDTGWVLGRLAAAVPTGRLTQWKFDEQGWTLTGHIPGDDLQSWLRAWQAQAPALGPLVGLDLAAGGRESNSADSPGAHADAHGAAGAEKSLRFVLRFASRGSPAQR